MFKVEQVEKSGNDVTLNVTVSDETSNTLQQLVKCLEAVKNQGTVELLEAPVNQPVEMSVLIHSNGKTAWNYEYPRALNRIVRLENQVERLQNQVQELKEAAFESKLD